VIYPHLPRLPYTVAAILPDRPCFPTLPFIRNPPGGGGCCGEYPRPASAQAELCMHPWPWLGHERLWIHTQGMEHVPSNGFLVAPWFRWCARWRGWQDWGCARDVLFCWIGWATSVRVRRAHLPRVQRLAPDERCGNTRPEGSGRHDAVLRVVLCCAVLCCADLPFIRTMPTL
jgi:hypothetical protein